jgi:4-alpha-glucanotransferase
MIAPPSRRAGLSIPLFSCPSTRSWGIGEISDIPALTHWLVAAGLRVLQLLPLNEMAAHEQSPYSAITAMAIDPLYISLADVPEFVALGGESALGADDRALLDRVRASKHVDYSVVRRLKRRALDRAFQQFMRRARRPGNRRARALQAFVDEQSWWLDSYAIYRAIHAREQYRPWSAWPERLRDREGTEVDAARLELAGEMLRWQYFQWLADTQWRAARQAAMSVGVSLFGDLPFMVDGDSADVWANQHLFMLDASLGVPPDAFSATGQDWGMPVYRWDAMAADDFRWLRDRARRYAALYDGFRVDHLVGFYRTYGRLRDGGAPFFTPADEPSQIVLGERVLGIFQSCGAEIVAEDLGVVPDFVRASLAHLGVPGFRVARWEREWHLPQHPFRDPLDYPVTSVAASGTHDTETLVEWWASASAEERAQVAQIPSVQLTAQAAGEMASGDERAAQTAALDVAPFNPVVRDALLASLFAAGSDLLLLPVQDAFGWSDRINVPATVNTRNWTYRLPWPVDRLDDVTEACERRDRLRSWAVASGRLCQD